MFRQCFHSFIIQSNSALSLFHIREILSYHRRSIDDCLGEGASCIAFVFYFGDAFAEPFTLLWHSRPFRSPIISFQLPSGRRRRTSIALLRTGIVSPEPSTIVPSKSVYN